MMSWRITAWPLAAFLLSAPFVPGWVTGWLAYDVTRGMQLVLLAVCACGMLSKPPTLSPISTRLAGAIGLLVLLLAASTLRAAQIEQSAREMLLLIGLGALSLSIASQPVEVQYRFPVLAGAALAAHAPLVLALTAAEALSSGRLNPDTLLLGFDNPRAYNHVQTVAIPLVAIGMFSSEQWVRHLCATGLISSVTLLWTTGGRGTAAGLIAATLVLFALRSIPARRLAGLLFAAMLVGAMLWAFLYGLLPLMATSDVPTVAHYEPSRMTGGQSRAVLWHQAIALIQQSPWLGVGPMHFAQGYNDKAAHPHSLYLQLAAEWGLPAALLTLGLLLALVGRLAQKVRSAVGHERLWSGLGLLAAWVALLIDSLVSGNWVMPVSQVWIAFLLGWTLAWLRVEPQAPTQQLLEPTRRFALVWTILLSQAVLWVLVWPEIRDLPAHLRDVELQFPSLRWHPRFWSHGHF